MSVVKVQRYLDFRNGRAKHHWNVLGPMNQKMVRLEDYFTGVSLDTSKWATSLPGSSDTIAINEQQGGACRLTTGTADNDSCMLASAIIFSGTKKAIVEADITITDVTGTGLFVGFSDAKSEANGSLAIHYPVNSLTTVATDAAGFVIDADHSTSSVMVASVQNGSDTTPVDLAVDWGDGERRTLRVELDSTSAYFYMWDSDGTFLLPTSGHLADSVTAATLLCVTVQAITRANDGANTVDVHSIKVWEGL